ncbi:MAG: DUF2851 family protein [Opitutus sp.]|nr:DUF2851 family protein [Opitutus sp.]MCS6248234.1 DUF2851 family protein [Opitutus sp.]MCS6274936.1 DUF2851 family protein [Opitutus sp.]MCS6278133.1 DUF2851 family protein [Opitutus sp.]MCS6299243.1 DUF2851 family protein [Opitutus sp.]
MRETHSEPTTLKPSAVAELQGLYGAFTFPERLLQQIWQRSDYDTTHAHTADGRPLKIRYPGRWNHLGGPDFAGARLNIGGQEISGDVELHLNAQDWYAHGHASNPTYDNVILHVVLFPCEEACTAGAHGRMIPILCLLPRLHHGLEEYAADAAIEQLAGRPLHRAQEKLGLLSNIELDTVLRDHAQCRWRSKVYFAQKRIARLGWESACHHVALEILGYRFNRAPMLSVASAHPLAQWTQGQVAPDQIFSEDPERWVLQGVRPLNHPRLRLNQYAQWCRERPDWPERLQNGRAWRALQGDGGSAPPTGQGKWRRRVRLTAIRAQMMDELCANRVSGSRFDNLTGDGFMPLLAAQTGLNLAGAWLGWFAGDAPESAVKVLKALGAVDGRDRPVAQGPIQGLLGWMMEQERCAEGVKRTMDGRGT